MMRELFDTRERPLYGQALPVTLGPLPHDEVVAELSRRFGDEAIQVTEPSHEATWQAADASERIVLAAVADGAAPASRLLAEAHNVARSTLDHAADRLAGQGHLVKEPPAGRVLDPLLAEWLRRR